MNDILNFGFSGFAMTWPSWLDISTAIPVIISLIIIEGLLSVDNALAIAAMAAHLPGMQKYLALKYGIIGAYVFRGLCMWGAVWIIANPWLKIIGAAYLIHLMAAHFSGQENEDGDDDPDGGGKKRGFWMTVLAIEFMDLSLSVDNVVAAVAIDNRLWVVCTGVFIGILALRFLAGYCIKLIEKFPILENTAFLLIGFVGCILLVELTWPAVHINSLQKFIGIVIIVALSIIYERTPVMQKALQPVFKVAMLPLKLYSLITGTILGLIFKPFRLIVGLFQKEAETTSE
jgi:YkoY family integral membrane protein